MARKLHPHAKAAAAVAGVVLGFAGLLGVASASEDATIPFPEGYRHWPTVKSYLKGPETPTFERDGGFRHTYANATAMEGYRTGKFPDGSVLVDERLSIKVTDGLVQEVERVNVNVMVKDSRRFAASDGWGYETFKNGNWKTSAINADIKLGCHACHSQVQARDFVFSKWRE